MINLEKLFLDLDSEFDEMVRLRRLFHMYPELSYKEKRTSNFIYEYFKEMDLKITKVDGKYGLLITLNEHLSDKGVYAFRSDFDALPIIEDNNYEYKSRNEGVFHGCGHDSHTAYLMVLLKKLYEIKSEINCCLKFIFQHAEEEVPGGAVDFINQGHLDDVKAIFAIHNMPQLPVGHLAVSSGGMLAGVERFKIKITGRGGHSSNPSACIDPIVCCASFISSVQSIVSRNVDALDSVVISFGKITSNGSTNVISDWVEIDGDMRNLLNKTTDENKKRLEKILISTCIAYECEPHIEFKGGHPALENSEEYVEVLKNSITAKEFNNQITLHDNIKAMGSEDAARYLLETPGVYFGVGSMPSHQKPYELHNAKFDIDEKYMLVCAKTMSSILKTLGL